MIAGRPTLEWRVIEEFRVREAWGWRDEDGPDGKRERRPRRGTAKATGHPAERG
jgi:hypothetical protein